MRENMTTVFWDFDGTLVHSNSLWSNSVYFVLREIDCNTTVRFFDIRTCMAFGFTWHTPNEDYSNMIYSKRWDFMVKKIRNDYISLGVDEHIAEKAAERVPTIIKKLDNYIVYNDAVDSLKKSIACGNKNVILSNNYPDLIDVLNGLGLADYFDGFIVPACVGYDKPRKEIFDYAKRHYLSDNYIMIGDSVNADVIGAANADMKTILVHNGFNDAADICCDNLSDIDFG